MLAPVQGFPTAITAIVEAQRLFEITGMCCVGTAVAFLVSCTLLRGSVRLVCDAPGQPAFSHIPPVGHSNTSCPHLLGGLFCFCSSHLTQRLRDRLSQFYPGALGGARPVFAAAHFLLAQTAAGMSLLHCQRGILHLSVMAGPAGISRAPVCIHYSGQTCVTLWLTACNYTSACCLKRGRGCNAPQDGSEKTSAAERQNNLPL